MRYRRSARRGRPMKGRRRVVRRRGRAGSARPIRIGYRF